MWQLFESIKHHLVPAEENAYRPHILGRSWLLFFFALVLVTEGYFVAGLIILPGQNFIAAVASSEVIALTNSERTQFDIGTLKENPLLDAAAQAKADDMAAKGYFSHVGPDGKEPWAWITGAGYAYQYAGENLAVRFNESADVVNAWMASPTHRSNILKSQYADIGVGVAQGTYQGVPATFVVQYFGTKETALAAAFQAAAPAPVKNAAVVASSSPAVPAGQKVATLVKGAETGPMATITPQQTESAMQSLTRQFKELIGNIHVMTPFVLGGVAALIFAALIFSFFFRHHSKRLDMLADGGLVVAFALILFILNAKAPPVATPSTSQSATVANSLSAGSGVIIDPESAATER